MKKQIIKIVGAGEEAATQLSLFLRSCIVIFQKKNFFFLGFALQPFTNHRTAGELEGIYLTPHYHNHPLHRHLHISRSITAESSPLHIRSNRT